LVLDQLLLARLNKIKAHGVPNYFGQQRFGFDGYNIDAAREMFDGRKVKNRDKRSIYLSAARSFIFNDMVSHRIVNNQHQSLLSGDTLMLAGSKASFTPELNDQVILERFNERDVILSAPMWGKGALSSHGEASQFEQHVALSHQELTAGLERAGLKQERRALMLYPQQMQWCEVASGLELEFELPAGSYATSILRELCQVEDGSQLKKQTQLQQDKELK
jgi:tRNA pseudouridine13 synthase